MFVTDMTVYTDRLSQKEKPSWADVEAAVHALDGDACSEVVIGRGEDREPFMGVGGGEDGQYAVSVNAEDSIFILINPIKPEDETICLLWGGQDSEFEARQVVDFAMMFRAVRTFTNTGQRDPSLVWWHNPLVSTA